MIKKFSLKTKKRDQMIEITTEVKAFLTDSNMNEGAVIVYSPHTTAGITINENADPDVKRDMLRRFDELYPWSSAQDLHAEGNTAAHLKTVMVGSGQTILIHNNELLLGRWQGIYFCEFDGPRERSYYVKIIGDNRS